MDLSTWTKYADNAFCTEASSLGLPPGQPPPTPMPLPDGRMAVAWTAHHTEDGITHWDAVIDGTTYTIAND